MENFTVKQESVIEFFKTWVIGFNIDPRELRDNKDFIPYHLFKDDIYIKKDFLLTNDADNIKFLLSDQTMGSRTILTNLYTYSIQEYDNVGLKLSLIDFKVELAVKQ